jgi:hypothetical protein
MPLYDGLAFELVQEIALPSTSNSHDQNNAIAAIIVYQVFVGHFNLVVLKDTIFFINSA